MGTETHDHDENIAAQTATQSTTDDSADFALGPSTSTGTWSSRATSNSNSNGATERPALSSARPKLSEVGIGSGSGSGFGGGGGSGFHRDHSFGRDHGFHRDRSDRGGDKPHARPAITRGPPCDLRASGGDTEKHALEHAWVLWFDNPQRQKEGGGTWFENLAQVAIFNTVEDFWAIMNHIRNPNDLDNGANYHFFKEGVKPMWEDEANKGGGKWVVTLWDETTRVDTMWEALLLGMIGEMLGSDDVVDTVRGAVISKRKAVKAQKKGPRVSLWLGKISSDEAILAVGQRMREALNLPQHIELEFQLHEDAEQAGHSYLNPAKLTC